MSPSTARATLPADFATRLEALYGPDQVRYQTARWEALAGRYAALTGPGTGPARYFSAPGRTELGGNHTDHNHGSVLAASINLDTIAIAGVRDDLVVRINSEDYPPFQVDLGNLGVHKGEEGSTAALVRGVADWFVRHGHGIRGFDAVVSSTVLRGSGLSSSASFEVLVGTILRSFGGADLGAVDIGIAGQYAENTHFGKPCGLMDQVACAHGGVVAIDFAVPGQPMVEAVAQDFASLDHRLFIVAVGDDHADLTHEYAAIPAEMKSVAAFLGRPVLAGIPAAEILAAAPTIRKHCGDRALLRALHFAGETVRPHAMVAALKAGDMGAYLGLMQASGDSSRKLLQNLHPAGSTLGQAMDVALAASELFLAGRGASRVHGGGFGGTIQVVVPTALRKDWRAHMEAILGPGTVHELTIRTVGACEV